ncbi:glycosyltransferase [Anabaena azotica]|uniref:Glycosyltransferase n=1 Tax=Anabaena azotica FACHB-119 TaxID=947527 RepID=A0ABR8D5I5_9NOST|nr:glycosyltransferase [Anabaena azotica]MBD2501502.1 glycosyltransferase [Anabaena azotica FACHB-119]
MKVLHIIPSVASVRGGPSQAIIETVKSLRNIGVEAEIVTTNDNGDHLLDVPMGEWIEYKQVPVQFFPRFSPPIHAIREFAFSHQLTLWLWKNAAQYDLLHIHAIFSYACTAAMRIARLQGIPYIVRPLGQLCKWSLQQSPRKKQVYLDLIERANINQSLAIHLTSEQEQQEVSLLGFDAPSFVLPHGLAIPDLISNARHRLRKQLNLADDEPVILFLSRLHPKKGLDYIIPALGKLLNHRFTFILAGSGSPEYEAEVESLLIANGMRERTRFVGFVEGETKNIFMQGADLFVLTSHSENFGIAVLEALAVGVPVLVTPGVALASLVQQHQLGYVPQLEVLDIASALDDYFSHPQAAKDMGDRARKLIVKNYTWTRIAEHLSHIYMQLIN